MCGIVALYSAREPIRADALERATRRLAHRGPDAQRTSFYDQTKVVGLLDELPALGDDTRTALDPVLMILLSACCLHERYFQ